MTEKYGFFYVIVWKQKNCRKKNTFGSFFVTVATLSDAFLIQLAQAEATIPKQK